MGAREDPSTPAEVMTSRRNRIVAKPVCADTEAPVMIQLSTLATSPGPSIHTTCDLRAFTQVCCIPFTANKKRVFPSVKA